MGDLISFFINNKIFFIIHFFRDYPIFIYSKFNKF